MMEIIDQIKLALEEPEKLYRLYKHPLYFRHATAFLEKCRTTGCRLAYESDTRYAKVFMKKWANESSSYYKTLSEGYSKRSFDLYAQEIVHSMLQDVLYLIEQHRTS